MSPAQTQLYFRAWQRADLPPALRRELEAVASRRNVTAEQLLAAPPQPFQAPKRFAKVAPC